MRARASIERPQRTALCWLGLVLSVVFFVAASFQISVAPAANAQGTEVSASTGGGCPDSDGSHGSPLTHHACMSSAGCWTCAIVSGTAVLSAHQVEPTGHPELEGMPSGSGVAPPFHPPKLVIQV